MRARAGASPAPTILRMASSRIVGATLAVALLACPMDTTRLLYGYKWKPIFPFYIHLGRGNLLFDLLLLIV